MMCNVPTERCGVDLMLDPSMNAQRISSQRTFFLSIANQSGDHSHQKNGAVKLLQETRKLNCPAQVHLEGNYEIPSLQGKMSSIG